MSNTVSDGSTFLTALGFLALASRAPKGSDADWLKVSLSKSSSSSLQAAPTKATQSWQVTLNSALGLWELKYLTRSVLSGWRCEKG
jgi:hypothetical protein